MIHTNALMVFCHYIQRSNFSTISNTHIQTRTGTQVHLFVYIINRRRCQSFARQISSVLTRTRDFSNVRSRTPPQIGACVSMRGERERGRQKHEWNDTVRQIFLTHTCIVAGIRERACTYVRTYVRTHARNNDV